MARMTPEIIAIVAVEKEQARTSGLLKGLGITGRAAQTLDQGAD